MAYRREASSLAIYSFELRQRDPFGEEVGRHLGVGDVLETPLFLCFELIIFSEVMRRPTSRTIWPLPWFLYSNGLCGSILKCNATERTS